MVTPTPPSTSLKMHGSRFQDRIFSDISADDIDLMARILPGTTQELL